MQTTRAIDGEVQRRMKEYENPCWGYRLDEDGEVEKQIFDGALPRGWADSPAKAQKRRSGKKGA